MSNLGLNDFFPSDKESTTYEVVFEGDPAVLEKIRNNVKLEAYVKEVLDALEFQRAMCIMTPEVHEKALQDFKDRIRSLQKDIFD